MRFCLIALVMMLGITASLYAADAEPKSEENPPKYRTIELEGWTILINERVDQELKAELEKALPLLTEQLQLVVKAVPAEPLKKLRKVKLYVNPSYKGIPPRCEYHPGAGWLRANHRDPQMAKGVEITDLKNFDFECKRMPALVLHELAHAYHDQVLGNDHEKIKAAYKKAVESKSYDKIERFNGPGRKNSVDRAYAMSNPQEYFAETTEAFFARNDFYPFNKAELEKHDPDMFKILQEVWKVSP